MGGENIDWRHYGVLLGWSSGYPNPKTNIDEAGAEQYCQNRIPLNFLWSNLVNEVAIPLRDKNPALVEDMAKGCEETLPANKYDEDCVPESYLNGKRYGLARESANLLTTQLVESIIVATDTGSDVRAALFGQLGKLAALTQDSTITTTAQLYKRFSYQKNSGHCSLAYISDQNV